MSCNANPFVQRIHQLVYEKLNSLKPGVKPQPHEWTVVSSVIMEEKEEFNVIVLTTGTKCIGQSALSQEGFLVNDCHAEVLCRRGLIRWIMEEMKRDQSTVVSYNKERNRWKLNENIKFHMYISQSPCGYGSIYPQKNGKRQAVEIAMAKQRHSKRVKVNEEGWNESTETSMHISGAKFQSVSSLSLSTKPGRGDPSRSYSCSDKLCLWNRIGYQGACLSTIMDPIFVSSIIIGGSWETKQMEEALITRFGEGTHPIQLLQDVEECPYSEKAVLRHLKENQKLASCGSSLVWIYPNITEQLIPNKGIRLGTNYKKGITLKNTSSLCPKRLFQLFHSFSPCDSTYEEVKQKATAYQAFKQELHEWKRKERQFSMFQS